MTALLMIAIQRINRPIKARGEAPRSDFSTAELAIESFKLLTELAQAAKPNAARKFADGEDAAEALMLMPQGMFDAVTAARA